MYEATDPAETVPTIAVTCPSRGEFLQLQATSQTAPPLSFVAETQRG